jgi:hypothetical protein
LRLTVCNDDGVSAGNGFVSDGFGEIGCKEDCVFELGVRVVGGFEEYCSFPSV